MGARRGNDRADIISRLRRGELCHWNSAICRRWMDGNRRAVYGGTRKFQDDPHWKDLLLFYEYFHGDNGAGLGASHQTGWTGIVARIMHFFASTTAEQTLELGKAAVVNTHRPTVAR